MKNISSFCLRKTKRNAIATLILAGVSWQSLADINTLNTTMNLAQKGLSVNGNAAATALTIDRQDPYTLSGGTFRVGAAFEYGNLDDIFELYNKLAKNFKPSGDDGNNGGGNGGGDDQVDWDEIFEKYPELEDQLKALKNEAVSMVSLFALISSEGYAKAEFDMEMSFVLQDDFLGGTWMVGNDLQAYSKAVGIFEDIDFDIEKAEEALKALIELEETDPLQEIDLTGGLVLFYDPATGKAKLKVDNDSLLLVKTALVNKFNVSYSRKAFENEHGSLYWGAKPTLYYVGLSNVSVSIGDITDSEKIFNDIRNADYHYTNALDLDLGVMWASKNYQIGASLNNVVESSYEFPQIDRSKLKSLEVASKLLHHESFVMERQLKLEGAWYTEDRSWSVNMDIDVNKIHDPMKDEYQWASISGTYNSENWWLPSARLGYSRNLVGSKLHYINAGVTFAKYVNLDIATTLNTVTLNDTKLMRGLNINLGFQFDY